MHSNAAMFARHTPTRMRGSGVVQSLKSLAAKLHPQLPLSPKESQRLLTALTSSFRQKLDEAHPPRAQDEDARPKLDQGRGLNSGHHALHTSSVAFADKHLATVLTNPLLAKSDGAKKPALSLETAKRELQQNPDRDPISILEEYQEKGAATIPIANFCLRAFIDSLVELSVESRQEKLTNTDAGRRTLQWLWTSKLFETDEFADNRALMGAIVTMTLAENRERFLWSWLRLDQRHNPKQPAFGKPRKASRTHLYRWKDFMLRLLILSKYDNASPASLNDVLDAWFKAVDLKLDVAKESTTNFIPLGSSVSAINDRILNSKDRCKEWDVKRYDRYLETVHLGEDSPTSIWPNYYKAQLWLAHPKNPSPLPMFEILKASFEAEVPSEMARIWSSLTGDRRSYPKGQKIRLSKYFLLIETAKQLKDRGHTEELDWLVSQIVSAFPDLELNHARNLAQGSKSTTHPTPRHAAIRLSLPSLTGAGTA